MNDFKEKEPQLISAFKSGNSTSFAKIYGFYYPKLCNYAYSLTKNEEAAKDIVHDVFIAVWEKRERIKNIETLKQYLYKSTYNIFVITYRENKKKIKILEELRMEVSMEVDTDLTVPKEELLNTIKNFVEELPPKRKNIFKLNKFQQYRYKEIAQELNISERTVEAHIRKAIISLRQRIQNLKNYNLLLSLIFTHLLLTLM